MLPFKIPSTTRPVLLNRDQPQSSCLPHSPLLPGPQNQSGPVVPPHPHWSPPAPTGAQSRGSPMASLPTSALAAIWASWLQGETITHKWSLLTLHYLTSSPLPFPGIGLMILIFF